MELEIITLCDEAAISEGKLNIIGSFDQIKAKSFPCRHPHCAVAVKLRFKENEHGEHSMELRMNGPGEGVLLEKSTQRILVEDGSSSHSHFHIWNLSDIELGQQGDYCVEMWFDGMLKGQIPVFARSI